MTISAIRVSSKDFEGLDEVPSHVRRALVGVGLPEIFGRFEVALSVDSFRVADWSGGSCLILGETDSGAVAVDLASGSVWWLQGEITSPRELRLSGYRQFINSGIRALVRCAEAYADLLEEFGPDADRLRSLVQSADPEALDSDREGVWRDVVLDWSAGL